MSEGLSAAEIGQLAHLYRSVQSAREVLVECGMPREMVFEIAHAGDVRTFWEGASRLLENGVLVAGRARLLETVRRSYPAHALFAGQREAPAERRPEVTRSYHSDGPMYVVERAEGPVYFGAPPAGEPPAKPEKSVPTSVFFVGTSPFDIDLGRLRADREFQAAHAGERRGVLRVVSRTARTVAEVAGLLAERPDVLHLVGRASGGALRFGDPYGDTHQVSVEALASRLRAYRDHTDFVLSGLVLSAGRSAEFAELFEGLAKTVVAWNNDLGDDCAIAFSAAMYRHLAQSSVRSLGAAARVAAEEVGGAAAECRNLPEQLHLRSV
ncbi:effector-associated domain EAD1-containing protein [Lentzea sp. NBRC 102530]|uniref:effector-associated domain EAD1-containing protein n=1 Tax=Lentzea sp. NBRC 102530 TaxID=3032201 RepID=UPI0024A1D6B3|nr:effector-associated domain EAD1-containing protein [Lentzea sp. NBRC 102530]GLY50780.1 hypothetical protein Lesp01_44360 [Lentzea sp. NBRC 102530]